MTPNNNMTYEEFLNYKNNLPKEHKFNLIDLSNNNLYGKFDSISKYFEEISNFESIKNNFHVNGNVHRCHLVEDYLNNLNINLDYKKNILFTQGIRFTLKLFAEDSHFNKSSWLIPNDVYPFYQKVLKDIECKEYKTLGLNNCLNDLKINLESFDGKFVLLTLPMKPLGIRTEDIIEELNLIISNNKDKTFIIDAVYANDKVLFKNIFSLYELGNVILMHSMSKMWAIPNIMGLTFFPESYSEQLNNFKKNNIPVSKTDLIKSYLILHNYNDYPNEINKALADLKNITFNKIKELGFKLSHHYELDKNGYLFYIPDIEPEKFFSYGVLVLPASIFGGKSGSIISTLNILK